jgi:hypothetical protein
MIFSFMDYQFASNEFTANELLQFYSRAYGTQINGTPFTYNSLQNWRRLKKIPVAYGGYKIISATRYKHLNDLLVLKIDGLTREDAEAMIGSFNENESAIKSSLNAKDKNLKPRKQRTKLYYQTLEAAGKQYTKKTLEQATLPKYWKEAGIKKNQMVNRSRTKKLNPR